jgi:4-amino-4-deoxy-L-arabinose transferase-like glycosyltransferase
MTPRHARGRIGFSSPLFEWLETNHARLLTGLVVAAAVTRALLAVRSPTPYGYVFDFYHEAIQLWYVSGRLPPANACWQCYQPPLLPLVGLPLYALGKGLVGGPAGLADPALRFVTLVPIVSAAVVSYFGWRLLTLLRFRGAELVVGAAFLIAFPCLFISSYGIEADILLTALMVAFLFYLMRAWTRPRHVSRVDAIRLGLLAGLACETKYSGLIAPAVLVVVGVLAFAGGPRRRLIAQTFVLALVVCAGVGSWKYADNLRHYHTALFANGTAREGFAVTALPHHAALYDFTSFRMSDLVQLARGRAPRGQLNDLPFYRSVWTTLHAMAWTDMSFFSEPTRFGSDDRPYPRKHIDPWATIGAISLGLVPDALAIVGLVIALRRRLFWPILAMGIITSLSYAAWFLAQTAWALKTKYVLFLLPAFVVYVLIGWRFLRRRSAVAGMLVLVLLLATILVIHVYDLEFAWM